MPEADDVPLDLSRVVVVGTSCAGKTTFARNLADRLETDHTDLDSLSWLPNWKLRELEDFRALVLSWAERDRWVVDGNYTRVRDLLWSRATAVIWLDYPFALVLWRSLKRTVKRAVTGEEICNGNRESWRKSFFSRDSILLMGWIGCFAGYPDTRLCQAFNRSSKHGYQVNAPI